jgi:hypothetical protein
MLGNGQMFARGRAIDSSAVGGALVLAVAGWLFAAPASARDSDPGPLVYEVARECPSRALWLESLRTRLPPLLRTHPAIESLAVHVERRARTAPGSGAFAGEIESPVAALPEGSRQVHGESCEEVLEALTFIAALSLEQSFGTTDRGLGSPESSPAEASAPVVGAPSAPPEADRPQNADASSHAASALEIGALGFASVQSAIAPRAALDWGVGVSAGWQTPMFQPWFLLGVYFGSVEQPVLPGSTARARFEHWASHLVGCPWRFPSAGAWGVRPCLDLDVGRSSGQGRGVASAEQHAAPWLSSGTELRFELALWDRVQLGAAAGAVVPFWRSRFFFLPEVTAFQVPAVGLRAETFASLLF